MNNNLVKNFQKLNINKNNLDIANESKLLLFIINNTYDLYMKNGARSSKKVDFFHNKIKDILGDIFTEEKGYNIKTEVNIKSYNSSGQKKCDIVIFKDLEPYIIFPVKLIMSNYKQNKNNSWENLTGELIHIKWYNENIKIIPINILMNKTPYLDKDKIIKKFENITNDDINNYNILKEKKVCYDIINYIINVENINNINETFDKTPTILNYNIKTKYRSFIDILKNLI